MSLTKSCQECVLLCKKKQKTNSIILIWPLKSGEIATGRGRSADPAQTRQKQNYVTGYEIFHQWSVNHGVAGILLP